MSEKMLNAPVYYTLTQAQFNPVAAMAKYIDEIQDKLRLNGYTLFEAQKITQLRFQSSSSASTKAKIPMLLLSRMTVICPTKLSASPHFSHGGERR
jgi:uncharacterized protein (TIGR04255 family)